MSRSGKALAAAFAGTVIIAAGIGMAGLASAQQPAPQPSAAPAPAPAPARAGLGREAHPDEVAAWSIAVRPDGQGLPPGRGTVKQGEELYQTQCAVCHGEFGEGAGRWPVLAGGRGTLTGEGPEKTVGSFWPYLSTVFDYVRRTMPYGNARSLSDDDVYALTAYLLHLNDVVPETFELTRENFAGVRLPNAEGFFDDDRQTSERQFWGREPCMSNCRSTPARVTGRARVIDVTPEGSTGPRIE
ncbi:c-type cytochrome [Phreatobacter sp.]|uniref:c-type cytochrome n=1 Tax=Phreatobacter sp. TaxID=1966341 RepID=UPI003F6E9812